MTHTETLKTYLQQGWELEDENQYTYKLTKNKQSMFIHIIIACIFPVIGNGIYWYMSNKKMTIMKD